MFHGSQDGKNGKKAGGRKKVKRSDGGRMHAPLMSRAMAMRLINGPAMDDNIFKTFCGQKIHRDVRRALMWLAPPEVKYQAHPTATKLNDLVQTANEKKIPATRRIIKRAVDLAVISEEKEGREVYYYVNHHQHRTTNLILLYTDVVSDVVRQQVADPYNPTAGIEIFEKLADQLPKDFEESYGMKPSEVASKVYYNIISAADFPQD